MKWIARDAYHFEREDGRWSIIPCVADKFALCCLKDSRPIVSGLASKAAAAREAMRQDKADGYVPPPVAGDA